VIRTRIGPDRIFHRYHSPDWASLPLSGAGAAISGGRFNRPGVEALYLSADAVTALAEYQQGASIAPPGTLVAYRINMPGVVDFSGGFDAAHWSAPWAEAGCGWKYLARIEQREPPSWRLGDGLIRDGTRGLLFPSVRNKGGINLVLFMANLDMDCRVDVHDPDRRLPRDRRSWEG
jgi:RES domain-containing protein